MPLLSSNKRKESSAPAGAVDEAATVQAARTRARRRLIGAAVLVGIGIVGFPLLFETQPRPVAVNIPIEIPSKDQAPPLALPASKPGAAAASRPARTLPPAERVAQAQAEEPPAPASRPEPVAKAAPSPPASAVLPASVAVTASAVAAPKASAPPARVEAPAVNRSADAQRAQDLLDGRALAAASTPAAAASEPKTQRFIVQAGAYTDAGALRDARQKVEKLGLKTYTQVIDSDGASRTRVRVGPFATRDEAEKAAARIKAAGLAAAILVI